MYTPRFVAAGIVKLLGYAPLGNPDWFSSFTSRAILSRNLSELFPKGGSMLDSSVVIGASARVIAVATLQLPCIAPGTG
jgi:hypothetical protein